MPTLLATPVPIGSCKSQHVTAKRQGIEIERAVASGFSKEVFAIHYDFSRNTAGAGTSALENRTALQGAGWFEHDDDDPLISPGLSRSLTTPFVVKDGAAAAVIVNDRAETSGNEN